MAAVNSLGAGACIRFVAAEHSLSHALPLTA